MFCVLLVAAKDPASGRQFSSQVGAPPAFVVLALLCPSASSTPTWGGFAVIVMYKSFLLPGRQATPWGQ